MGKKPRREWEHARGISLSHQPPGRLPATGQSEVLGRRGLKALSREEDGPQLRTVLTAVEMVHKDPGLDRFGEKLILISVARPEERKEGRGNRQEAGEIGDPAPAQGSRGG